MPVRRERKERMERLSWVVASSSKAGKREWGLLSGVGLVLLLVWDCRELEESREPVLVAERTLGLVKGA